MEIVNIDKPFYQRKPRKDGTTRKARVFGRPYWYEKAGWSEEKSIERRAILKDRIQAKWPDWGTLKQTLVKNQEIQDWLRPIVVDFDDNSWCLPNSSDPQERLQEQLSIYAEWAKSILRDASRPPQKQTGLDQSATSNTGRTPGYTASSTPVNSLKQLRGTPGSPYSAATSMRFSENPVSSRYTSFTPVNRAKSYGTEEGLSLSWGQTKAIDTVSEADAGASHEAEADALATTWNFSTQGDSGAKSANGFRRQSDYRSKPHSFATPSRVERNTAGAMPPDYSSDDEETEATEVSDSEPARQTSNRITSTVNDQGGGNSGGKPGRKWRDIDWDDVVVTIDATNLVGESFPIPMTMMKPGSSRSLCRWDDFELHDLHARLEVEAGQKIDWTKYMIVSMVNSKPIAINTPGKYKLLLKEYSEKTRPSSATVLYLRVRERIGFAEVARYGPQQRTQLHNQVQRPEKRSQFTGAPSDFSSDSSEKTELTPPPSTRVKRPRHNDVHRPTSASNPGTIIGRFVELPSNPLDEQSEQSPPILIDNPIAGLKMRMSPEEST